MTTLQLVSSGATSAKASARALAWSNYLRAEGYCPEVDSEGDIILKSSGFKYLITIDERDSDYFRIVFPGFWSIENEDERPRILAACVRATERTKVGKVFVVQDGVWAAVEMLMPDEATFQKVFDRCQRILQGAARNFAEHMCAK